MNLKLYTVMPRFSTHDYSSYVSSQTQQANNNALSNKTYNFNYVDPVALANCFT